MNHVGIGVTHVNEFLSIDMLLILSKMMKRRSEEAGPKIEQVAQSSCEEARVEKRRAERQKAGTSEEGQDEDITVSYDMGWQKPSCFNSQTGL